LLDQGDLEYIAEVVKDCPTLYIDEYIRMLQRDRGKKISIGTLFNAFAKLDISRKKLEVLAKEADRQRHAAFVAEAARYKTEQLVFIDEVHSSSKTCVRTHGRSRRGDKVSVRGLFVRGKRYSSIGILHKSGMLGNYTVEGSIDSIELCSFATEHLLGLMMPFPAERSVLVLDNARIHKTEAFTSLIRAAGIRILYTPPYSPHFNPIEQAFAKIKRYLKRYGSIMKTLGYCGELMIDFAFRSVTASDCSEFMHDSGYH
jgi:hypothetical protein